MLATNLIVIVLLAPGHCQEPVKSAKAEYFRGDVADRFPPGHDFDNMSVRPSQTIAPLTAAASASFPFLPTLKTWENPLLKVNPQLIPLSPDKPYLNYLPPLFWPSVTPKELEKALDRP